MNESRRARLPPKPVIPFRRYVAKLVDSKGEDEEVYVLRVLFYRIFKMCVHVAIPRTLFFISMEEGASFINESNSNRVRNNSKAKKEAAEEELRG